MGVLSRVAVESGVTFDAATPMFAADDALAIVRWNDRAEALLGFTEGEVLGRPCHEVAGCPEMIRRAFCDRCRARSGGAGRELVPAFDQQFSTRSGEKLWVNVATLVAAGPAGSALRVHLLRDLTRERELQDVIRRIISTASTVSQERDRADATERGAAGPPGVTDREREVIRLLAGGHSTKAIAAKLGISGRTARNHVQNILCKLRLHSRLEVVAYAAARGLV